MNAPTSAFMDWVTLKVFCVVEGSSMFAAGKRIRSMGGIIAMDVTWTRPCNTHVQCQYVVVLDRALVGIFGFALSFAVGVCAGTHVVLKNGHTPNWSASAIRYIR
jgi:hypothetical protein